MKQVFESKEVLETKVIKAIVEQLLYKEKQIYVMFSLIYNNCYYTFIASKFFMTIGFSIFRIF